MDYTRAEKLPGILLFIDFELKNEFNLDHKQVSEAFLLPVKVANEPYLHSFHNKVLNSILFTDDHLCKIGYISDPNCTFSH